MTLAETVMTVVVVHDEVLNIRSSIVYRVRLTTALVTWVVM